METEQRYKDRIKHEDTFFILENDGFNIEIKKVKIDDEFKRDFEMEYRHEQIDDDLIKEFLYREHDEFRTTIWVLTKSEFKSLNKEIKYMEETK